MFVASRDKPSPSSVGAECPNIPLLRSYIETESRVGYKHPAPTELTFQTAS